MGVILTKNDHSGNDQVKISRQIDKKLLDDKKVDSSVTKLLLLGSVFMLLFAVCFYITFCYKSLLWLFLFFKEPLKVENRLF